jgi:hypothetical protein
MEIDADCPVLVYQMGKVASSSLCAALNNAGVPAAQTHFLGEAALTAILRRLLNPGLNEHFAYHLQGQLDANIGLTRQLLRVRRAVERGDPAQPKAKVISLAREPLDWYRAELVQNFAGHIPALRTFCGRAADDDGDDLGCIFQAHRALLATLADLPLPPLEQPQRVHKALHEALDRAGQSALLTQARNFLQPILWFQRLFREPIGVDVFRDAAAWLGPGAQRFQGRFCDVLVVRYESLPEALPALSDFTGVTDLALPRTNLSDAKQHFAVVQRALDQVRLPASFAQTLYRSAYCETFGYGYRDRFSDR